MGPIIISTAMIDKRTMREICDEARDTVKLPHIDRDWYYRWGRQLDCEPCPGNVVCDYYAFICQMDDEIAELRRTDA